MSLFFLNNMEISVLPIITHNASYVTDFYYADKFCHTGDTL